MVERFQVLAEVASFTALSTSIRSRVHGVLFNTPCAAQPRNPNPPNITHLPPLGINSPLRVQEAYYSLITILYNEIMQLYYIPMLYSYSR